MGELVPRGAAENILPFYKKPDITALLIQFEMF
jgi:hypothetical protein